MSKGKPKDGSRHPNFKTGVVKAEHGYILEFVGKGHHLADVRGYAYQHRLNAEIKLGRKLRKGEVVHHIDENRSNNDPLNLKVKRSAADHRHEHGKKNNKAPRAKNPIIQCACGCGTTFLKYDSVNRPRKYVSGHNYPMNG
jgi:hypothetical protein